MIRTLHATDLLRILLDGGSIGPDWAQTWDKLGRDAGAPLGPTTVVRGLVSRRRMERCSVCAEGAHLRALATVRARSGPRAWDVRCLSLSPRAEEEGIELLERLCVVVGRQGGERMFLRLSAASPAMEVAKEAGFVPLAREKLFRLEPPAPARPPTRPFRPYLPADEYALFRLYNACAPSRVRTAYALTFDEWRDAREPWGRSEHQGVHEGQGCLRGWVRVASSGRAANRIELMVHPEEETSTWEDLVAWGLQQGRPEKAFLALVPDHQPTLALVLERRGFSLAGEYHLMVKPIAVRVNEPALAPASA